MDDPAAWIRQGLGSSSRMPAGTVAAIQCRRVRYPAEAPTARATGIAHCTAMRPSSAPAPPRQIGGSDLACVPGRVCRSRDLLVSALIFVRAPGAGHACRTRGRLSSDQETDGSGSESGCDRSDWSRHGPSPVAGIERCGGRRARAAARFRRPCVRQRTGLVRQIASSAVGTAPQSSACDAYSPIKSHTASRSRVPVSICPDPT